MRHGRTHALTLLRIRTLILWLAALTLASCAEGGDGGDLQADDSGLPGFSSDSGNPYAGYEGGQSLPGPAAEPGVGGGMSGAPIGDGGLLGGLFGGGTGGTGGGMSVADAGENPEGWTLNADSAKECPAVPPPIPIVGGICVGIYFTCGWTNAKGAKYSCTCDWIHWLCI